MRSDVGLYRDGVQVAVQENHVPLRQCGSQQGKGQLLGRASL